jgi:L-alanine-DL-glutamate epimerase-like enolase superfamily enzyme
MTAGPPASAPAIRIDRVRVPFRRPFVTARGTWTARESWIVRVRGASGAGVVEMAAEARELQPGTIDEAMASSRLGAAVADAKAAALVGPPRALHAGVNATLEAASIDDLLADALAATSVGFRTLKLKVGTEATTAELVERLRALRGVVGSGVRLRLDANGAWDRATALERLTAAAPYDLELVEQPVPPESVADLAFVRGRSAVAVAADEAVTSFAAAEALLVASAVDALVLKPSRVGGLAAAREIAELAFSAGVPVILSTMFETGIGIGAALNVAAGLAAVLPPGVALLDHGLATAHLLADDLLVEPIRVDGGRASLSVLLPDDAAIERYRIADPVTDGWDA